MNRTEIINHYLDKMPSPKSYLEIGVRNKANNFDFIRADIKDGVDPCAGSKCNYVMTSDVFFLQSNKRYNLVFIDGLHTQEQVRKDVSSSLNFLTENGIIVLHDCNPPKVRSQSLNLNGTVWKAIVELRMSRSDLGMFVVDTDCGVGVIKPNKSQKIFCCPDDIFDYQVFHRYRKEALNLISVNDFKRMEQ